MLSVVVVLLLTGSVGWWWSTPGQLWWMQVKIRYRVLPMQEASSPFFYDHAAAIDVLEPQWSRLIERRVVAWYSRKIPRTWTDDERNVFLRRLENEAHIPEPYPYVFAASNILPEGFILIESLAPPDQHRVIDGILLDVLGTHGEDAKRQGSFPIWFNPNGR